ncbi:Conserved membrane protein of uncharacterised function [Mycobacteroides abscessus subsp. abscessus]|uniref:Conserved membrane protein of uncharacterized function n=11 Tax=Mycobacteroides abscessus TaxID=36809 RepID=A0A1M8UYK2_9MYCO|nr:hypothetical protein [Mycobacteroides abscessus]ESV59588.1 hypothetical protein L830_1420 [Mycobacteroides abscessus MAB_082312_2258]ESV64016.1 hypothetical protein L833_1395 [Mycobacteroides abscessus MAB_091912_2446]ETZ89896.1 hypothetical protein L829_3474 [Mycobacteroides abscessus MAB_030201_1075]ETZ92807.1 hypothetical protein L828_0599 [Mycobacteroides abscessus MAB_030201_1061]EUA44864.1 hypothetical protein I543_3071 [Mycobacteroides abscessus 21]EUA61470.1 hypothetical protein I5
MGRITAALLATASTATLTLALAPAAEAAPHQVKYVISSDRDFLSQTLVLQNEPPSKSAYDTESSKYLVRNSTRIAPDAPFVVETTLNDPTQWAYVSASAAAKAVTGAPVFHCEVYVDGALATQADGETAVTCSLRQW